MFWGKATKSLATFALVGMSVVGCASEPETEEQQSTSVEPSTALGESAIPEPSPVEIEPEELEVNPFDTPFPLEFTKEDLIKATLAELDEFLDYSNDALSVSLELQEGFPASEVPWIEEIVDAAATSLPFPSGSTALIAVGMDDDFTTEALQSFGLAPSYGWPACGVTTYESYCAGPGWAVFNYRASVKRPDDFNLRGKKAVVAHEMLHVWQFAVTKGNPATGPLWLEEGLAQVYGFAVGEALGLESYLECRNHELLYNPVGARPLEEHSSYEFSPYGIGMVASEYLIASVGFEAILKIYVLMGTGSTFEVAFSEAVGIEIEAFYEDFEAVRSQFS